MSRARLFVCALFSRADCIARKKAVRSGKEIPMLRFLPELVGSEETCEGFAVFAGGAAIPTGSSLFSLQPITLSPSSIRRIPQKSRIITLSSQLHSQSPQTLNGNGVLLIDFQRFLVVADGFRFVVLFLVQTPQSVMSVHMHDRRENLFSQH